MWQREFSDPSSRKPASRTHETQKKPPLEQGDLNVPAFLQRDRNHGNQDASTDLALHQARTPLVLHNHDNRESDSDVSDASDASAERRRVRFAAGRDSGDWRRSRSRSRSRVRTVRDVRLYHREGSENDHLGPSAQPMLHLDPLSPQDVTVHMSCPVQDDLEEVLEDCSRLRRLGHFAEAIALFRDRLSHFLDNRYVLVQYAQCLYEAGQHAEVVKLEGEMAPPRIRPPDALQTQWDMLVLAAGGSANGDLSCIDNKEGISLAIKSAVAGHWPKLDSTEVRLPRHAAIAGPCKHAKPRSSCWTVPTTRPSV